jgi:hypothetical protein
MGHPRPSPQPAPRPAPTRGGHPEVLVPASAPAAASAAHGDAPVLRARLATARPLSATGSDVPGAGEGSRGGRAWGRRSRSSRGSRGCGSLPPASPTRHPDLAWRHATHGRRLRTGLDASETVGRRYPVRTCVRCEREVRVAGGMGREDDSFPRETLAERVATTRARQAGLGHGTSGFHGTPPNASSAWTAPPATPPATPLGAPPVPPSALSTSASPPAARHPAGPVRPCWFESPWGRQPALLLRWRRADDGSYSGLVVVAAPDETGEGWTVIRLWAAASLLTPH